MWGPGMCWTGCTPQEEGGGGGQATDGLWTEARGQQKQSNDPTTTSTSSIRKVLGAADAYTAHPATSSTTSNTPTTGLRKRGNDTSRSTGRSGRQKAATRRNMRRGERMTVQGRVKKQQPDGMSHGGGPPPPLCVIPRPCANPPPPPPLPVLEADSQVFASAPSVPRGFPLPNLRRGPEGDPGRRGGPQPNPPPPRSECRSAAQWSARGSGLRGAPSSAGPTRRTARGCALRCGAGGAHPGQSTSYGDKKSSYGGAGGWDRRGCATWAPSSATRQGEVQHRHTKRGSHTKGDKGGHTRQGGGAQQGRRGYQNGGNREPEWSKWWSVRMGGSDNKGDGLASQPRRYRVPGQPLLNRHQVGGVSRSPDGLFAQQEREPIRGRPTEKDIWWTSRTARGGTGHLGRTETQRGRLWTACGQRCVDSKNSQTTPATTSTSSIRQLLGAADTQTAHHATFSTAPTRQLLGSANAETTPARAPATAADRK